MWKCIVRTDRHTHTQTDTQTDKQTDRQAKNDSITWRMLFACWISKATDTHTHTHTHTHNLTIY